MGRRQSAVQIQAGSARRRSGLVGLLLWAAAATGVAQERPNIVWMQGGHAFAVHSVAFSPDGGLIASAGAEGTVKLWRAADGALLRTLTGHDGDVNGVAFSPNGSYVASAGSDGTVRVWRTQDGRLLHTLVGEGGIVLSVAFSPNSQLVASGSEDGRVKLWRVSTGALERTIPAHDLWVSSVAFSPSGGVLASASADGTVKLWQVANGQPVGDIQAHALWVTHIAFSPDGQLLASAGEDGTVKLWRVSDRQLVRTLSYSDAAPVYGVAFSADGSLVAAGGGENIIKIWRVSDGGLQRSLAGHAAQVSSIAFAPSSPVLASSGGDGAIKLWRTTNGALLATLTGHTAQVASVAFAPNRNLLASGSGDTTVRLWRATDGGLERILRAHDFGVTSVAFSTDGQLLASGSEDGVVKLWRTVDGGQARTILAHAAAVTRVCFSPNGSLLATASEDGTIKLWRVVDGVLQRTINNAHLGYVSDVVFSPDGTLLASAGEDAQVKVWRIADGGLQRELTGHTAPVTSVAFSPNGSLIASGSVDTTVKIWRVFDGALTATLAGHTEPVYTLAFAPGGNLLASGGGDGVINLWRVSDGTRLRSYSQETGTGVLAIAFSPDGQLFGYGRLDATIVVARNPFPPNRPPAVPELVAPADGATVSPAPTLRVRLTDPDNDPVQAVIEISDASGVVRTLETGLVASGSEASVSVDPPLAAGSYSWRARARDSTGNTSDWSNTRAFTVQTPLNNRPPAVPELVAPADGATVSPAPTLRVRLTDPDNDQVQAVIEVYRGTDKVRTLETGLVASGSEASVSVNPSLEAGDYSWRARAKDSAGNASDWSNTRAFTVQTPPNNRPPAVPELVAPADGATVSPTPTLRVRLSDPDNDPVQAVIEISDASGVVRTLETGFVASGSEASVSVAPPLTAGSYSWRARARDSAGNASDWSNTRAFTVQTPPNNRPPAVPELVAPADGATVSPAPTLRVRLSDPDNDPVQAVIEVRNGSGVVRTLETGFVASGSEASVSVDPPLAAGDYTWRARARDSAGNASEWSAPRRIVISTSVPSRLVGIRTFALSLRTPTNEPNALGLNGVFIVRWDAAAQQYAQATQLRAGEAYFIKATNPVQPNLFGEPITGEITIPLKPGWNLIANPTLAPIEWRLDSVLVQRGSERRSLRAAQQAGWLDGYLWAWRQDPNNPMRGQYQFVYDASELQGVAGTLEPWQAYWILARVECTLVLNAAPSRAVDVLPAPSDSVWTLQVEAVNARGSGQSVWIGVAQGRSVQAMLAPEPPDGELPIQVRVRRVEGVFAADVRPTLTRDARWSLEVVVAPSDQPQPIRLRIHQATHLPRGVNLALVDEQSGARRPLRSAGASLTFTAPPEGGVFRFAIEPIARRTLLRVLNPTVRGGTRAGETLTLGFTLTAEAQVQVQIRTGSRTVRTLSDTRTRSAGLQEFVWDGRDDAGIHLPPGAYLAEITAVSADGQVARAVAPIIVRR
jgi:WD40 repeat protein